MKRRADHLQDHMSYPPRAMRAEQAAAYLSMGRTKFLDLVEQGRMPQPVPIDGMVSWDRLDLDAAYDDYKRGTPAPENTIARLLRKQAGA